MRIHVRNVAADAVSLYLTLEIGESDDGWWYTLLDAAGEPYAGGNAGSVRDAYIKAGLALEIPDPLPEPTPEEYAAEVARAKAALPDGGWKM